MRTLRAQGTTVDRAYVLLHDHGALREWGYVACTRARAETRLYLADHTIEREKPLRDPGLAATPERVAHALERSAAEPLALDQTARHSDMTARVRAQQQEQLDRQRDRAADRPLNGNSNTSAGAAATPDASSSRPRSPSTRPRSSSRTRSARSWS